MEAKPRILYLLKILLERTDEEHPLSTTQLIGILNEEYGISAHRTTITKDIAALVEYGLDIVTIHSTQSKYFVASRKFELPELKLLVDAIQSSKFITARKTNDLIRKLETFVSRYDAMKLQRQVYVSGRIKTMNESIYYTVDAIHNAISENKKIKFQYYQWNVKKEMELRHNGAWYHISPWGLSWDDENYYLVGYDSDAEKIKHYRVDKMLHIRFSSENREGKEFFNKLDMADYAKKSFGMFGGKEQTVKLLVKNNLVGVIIDRFGKNVILFPTDDEHFTVNVNVHVSRQFLGWVFSLGDGIKIVGPDDVVEQMRSEIKRLIEHYS